MATMFEVIGDEGFSTQGRLYTGYNLEEALRTFNGESQARMMNGWTTVHLVAYDESKPEYRLDLKTADIDEYIGL